MAAAVPKKPFLLTVEPSELIFSVPADKKNVELGRIVIRNPTPTPFGFKIKTTAPQQFCVKPCLGRIDPGQSVNVEVRLSAYEPKKVKFLVQAVDCQPEEDPNLISARFGAPDTAEQLIRGIVVTVDGAADGAPATGPNELMQTAVLAPVATSTPQGTASLSEPQQAAAAPSVAAPAPAATEQLTRSLPPAAAAAAAATSPKLARMASTHAEGTIDEDGDGLGSLSTMDAKRRQFLSAAASGSDLNLHRTASRAAVDLKGTRLNVADIENMNEQQRVEMLNLVKAGRMSVDDVLREVAESKQRRDCVIS
eukprot:m.159999 g.159999  ORF g.159999 m.159999 type:complete len:309 (+) comp15186_c0_seq1:23-949(+)